MARKDILLKDRNLEQDMCVGRVRLGERVRKRDGPRHTTTPQLFQNYEYSANIDGESMCAIDRNLKLVLKDLSKYLRQLPQCGVGSTGRNEVVKA